MSVNGLFTQLSGPVISKVLKLNHLFIFR